MCNFIAYRQFTDVAAGRIMKPGGPQDGDIRFTATKELYCRSISLVTNHQSLDYMMDYQGFEPFKG